MSDPTNPEGATPGVPPQPDYPVAPPTGQWAAPSPQPPGPATGAFAAPGVPPTYPGVESPTQAVSSGGGGKKLLVGLGALVVVGGGAFASLSLLGGSDDRGASSPEEAGQELVAALNQSDVLGVIDLLPDGERDVLLAVTDQLSSEGQRLGLLDDTFRLDGFDGVTITIDDPEFDVEELSDSDAGSLSRVSLVGGDASIEVDADALEGNVGGTLADLIDEAGGEVDAEDFDDSVDIADFLDDLESESDDFGVPFTNPFSVAVVEDDGRFFPSIGFTVAEFARQEANQFAFDDEGVDAPDLDDGIEPEGAGSPEEAVQALIDAATGADAEAALALLDPEEMGALQAYVPAFTDLPSGDSSGVDIEVTDADVESLGGGVNRVQITGLTVEGDLLGVGIDFVLDGSCVELSVDVPDEDGFELDRTCFDEPVESDIADDVDIPEEIAELASIFSGNESGIITVERDGEHFISPIRTLTDSVAGSVAGVDREDLEDGGVLFEAFSGGLDDEFDDLGEQLDDAFEDADSDEIAPAIISLLEQAGLDPTQVLNANVLTAVAATTVLGSAAESSFTEIGGTIGSDDFEDFEDFEDDFGDDTTDTTADDGFDDTVIDEPDVVRTPTGASGPAGEVLLGDVVEGSVGADGVTTFTLVGTADGALIGAQALDGSDLTLTVVDPATGNTIEFDDDFNAPDPEVLVFLEEGQVVTIEIREFSGDPGAFVLYYELF